MFRLKISMIMIAFTSLFGGNVNAADLNALYISDLQKAYGFIETKSYDEARKIYESLKADEVVGSDVLRAVNEAEGLIALLELNERIQEAEGDKLKSRLLRFQRRNVVGDLQSAVNKYKSETLKYMLALASEEDVISDGTYEGLTFVEEYKRLPKTPTKVAKADTKKAETNGVLEGIEPEDITSINGAKVYSLSREVYISRNAVNVRTGPGLEYKILRKIPKDDKRVGTRSILLSNGQTWYELEGNERYGYADARFFAKLSDVIAARAAQTSANKKKKAVKADVKTAIITPKPKDESGQKPPKEPKPVVAANKGKCSGSVKFKYSVTGKVAVLNAPNGKPFHHFKNTIIPNVVQETPSHLILRMSRKGAPLKCGYIKRSAALKRK